MLFTLVLIVIGYFFLHYLFYFLIIRFNVAKNKPLKEKKELSLKLFELFFASYFLISGLVLSILYLFLPDKNDNSLNYYAFINGLLLFAYFIYHVIYLIGVPDKKFFVIHHFLMMGFCYVILTNHLLYLYLMVAAIPSGSSLVRSWQWLADFSDEKCEKISPNIERILYLLFQLVPIAFIFIHFFFFNTLILPTNVSIELAVIGFGAAAIAIYLIKNQLVSLYYFFYHRLGRD